MIYLLLTTLLLISCGPKDVKASNAEEEEEIATPFFPEMEIVETVNLKVYYPQFSRIDLVCKAMPSQADSDVIFVAEAAFTAALLDSFKHTNIIGPHVSGGKLYQGCGNGYTSWFSYADGKHHFHTGLNADDRKKMLEETETQGGMAFTQYMIVADSQKTSSQPFKNNMVNEYRCLCEDKDGRLCIADGKRIPFSQFRSALLAYGMKHAIYLDMGPGWNHSWYRDGGGQVHLIHEQPGKYTTNWITFYK